MSTKDENGKIITKNTTPIKSRKRTSNQNKIQSPSTHKSPSPKKQRRVSFAPSKTVYQEEKKEVKRASLVPISMRERRKLVIPEDDENVKEKKTIPEVKEVKKTVQEVKKPEKRDSFLDADNLAAFRQELENLSDSSDSDTDKESDKELSFELPKDTKGKEATFVFEEEGNMEMTCTGPDFGKIIAQAKEQLKKHQESLNKTTDTSFSQEMKGTSTNYSMGDSETNHNNKNMEFTTPLGKLEKMDTSKTQFQSRMSITQGNYGKIQVEEKDRSDSMDLGDLDQSTPLNQSIQDSPLSIDDSPEEVKGRKSILGEERMSMTKDLFGKIQLEKKDNRKSIVGEHRMSMTNEDFGKIQVEKDSRKSGSKMNQIKEGLGKIFQEKEDTRKSLSRDETRKSDQSVDFANESNLSKSRKSVLGDFKMSMTKDDFGKIKLEQNEKLGRKSIVGETRMSMTTDDFGKIQVEKNDSRKSIVGEQRMSLANEGLGKIFLENKTRKSISFDDDHSEEIEKSRKSIVGEHRMSMTNDDFGNISVEEKDLGRKSIIGENKMSMTKHDFGKIQLEKDSRKSIVGEERMSLTNDDFGNLNVEKFDNRKSIVGEQRMSMTTDDFGNIQVEENEKLGRKSIVGEARMSMTTDDFGKIQVEKNDSRKSIVGEQRMSLANEGVGKIQVEKRKSILPDDELKNIIKENKGQSGEKSIKKDSDEDITVDTNPIKESNRRKSISDKLKEIKTKDQDLPIEKDSRKSIMGDQRMSLANEDFGKITVTGGNKNRKSIIERNNDMSLTLNDYGNRLFGMSDSEDEEVEKIIEEKFERPEDLLKMMNDSLSNDNLSKDILSKSPAPQKKEEERKTETFTLNLTDNTSTRKEIIQSTPTIEKKKIVPVRNTPQLTPSQKLIKSVQNLAEPKVTKTARSLNEKIESVKDETMELMKETPMIRIQQTRKELDEEIRENSKSIDISAMRMSVQDFLFITNIRFLDDLSNQKRPTSSIGFIKNLYNGNTQNDRIQSIYFAKSELEAFEKACDDICEISEGIKVTISKLEAQMNKRNPKIFLDIHQVSKDELIEINVSFYDN